MKNPDFIDNRNGNTLAQALAEVLGGGAKGYGPGMAEEHAVSPAAVSIASAFFSPAGFSHIADHLLKVPSVRLLLGAEPPYEAHRERRRLEETQDQFERRRLREGLKTLDSGLRAERDALPFTKTSAFALRKLVKVLRDGHMEVRRYEDAFLHAKAYIFSDGGQYGAKAGVIAGSSNLTSAGLTRNLELNLGRYDHPIVKQAQDWFDDLWDEATPFDLASLFEEVFAEWQPFDIFLRVLWQLYGEEVRLDEQEDRNLPLTSFQKHGVARALRLIDEYGGAIVADEVGLGKTFIAGEIIKIYQHRRQKALLICPAALRDATWAKFRSRNNLHIDCVSYEQLANDLQLIDPRSKRPGHQNLPLSKDEYQLVIVDEAHNYRNPDAKARAAVLRNLLFGQKRDLLLLTATPVNNSLWDLFHLIRFFIRQDSQLADRGILSLYERFKLAMREDPTALSPDMLYPIIDATTVKRTRQFVKKHYQNDTITGPDGKPHPIVFPEPKAMTVRYALDEALPGFFEKIESALDPDDHSDTLKFARYRIESYRRGALSEEEETDPERREDLARTRAAVGLLRSGLLKRFESSAHAFHRTVEKMAREHDHFLAALDQGKIINTAFLRELAGDDDAVFEDLLDHSDHVLDASDFLVKQLKQDVIHDRDILNDLAKEAAGISTDRDPKLKALTEELIKIARQAEEEGQDSEDVSQKRKVIIFSFFADTVDWIRKYLRQIVETNPELKAYKDRITAVAGSDELEDEVSRIKAVQGFTPISSEAPAGQDANIYDILIATDVLAEGVNLQQCRHIINFDLPWNPMRLVQRHGRIDRIGSPHKRVFLRTIFPADRLDQMLRLEQRILNKLAMAAASVGVMQPIEHAPHGERVFTETREEIERLLHEDSSLYERGGTASATQSGEEYRQTLRKALSENRSRIVNLPWKVGSGLVKGKENGIFFCAAVGDRTYLRFIKAEKGWKPIAVPEGIISEIGTCLRLIECEQETRRYVPDEIKDSVYDFWDVAQTDIWNSWMYETDPANLQPKIRPLNIRVAEFIRAHPAIDMDEAKTRLALDIIESPWPAREERMLRDWFGNADFSGAKKSSFLIDQILNTGLEPFIQPPVLSPISKEDVSLICWMLVTSE